MEELASRMAIKIHLLKKVLNDLGESNLNDQSEIDPSISELVVSEMNMIPVLLPPEFEDIHPTIPPKDISHLPLRPPIISVMGHVDHGKTTLLDALRQTSIAINEQGGITQSIGAFIINIDSLNEDKKEQIIVIDTPGHAAFSSMRERGTEVTDIIVLVIAADDGICEQTKEVITLAKDNNVPMIVAITKCDMHGNEDNEDEIKDKITNELLNIGVMTEKYGGDTQMICVSGKTGKGLDNLKEAILLQSEMMDLRADKDVPGEAIIIESSIKKGVGPISNAIVKWGTLDIRSYIVVGTEYCRIKSLLDINGKEIKKAEPSTPVSIIGLKTLPNAGENVLTVKNEKIAKIITENRQKLIDWASVTKTNINNIKNKRKKYIKPVKKNKRLLFIDKQEKKRIAENERKLKELENKTLASLKPGDNGYIPNIFPVIFKTDTIGVLDAIDNLINTIPTNQIIIKKIHSSVGQVTHSDLDLAETTKAYIFTFNSNHSNAIEREARTKNVIIRQHTIVYHLLDDIKNVLIDALGTIEKDVQVGSGEILQIISVPSSSRSKKIAGCRITSGSFTTGSLYRIVRNGKVIKTIGLPTSLRYFKDSVQEVNKGQECGITWDHFDDYMTGDILEAYKIKHIKRDLLTT